RQEPETTEDVIRSRLEVADEFERDEIYQDLIGPYETILRHAPRARVVCDLQFGDAPAHPRCEHGKKAMHLPVEVQVLHDLAPVRLERAAEVVQLNSDHPADEKIRDVRRQETSEPGILPVTAPARHDIVGVAELHDEPRDVVGIVLEVGVER